jgi:hypothetical protein
MLANAKHGLEELREADPAVRPRGIYNVAVFGRSVTLVLQAMRGVEDARFDEWYAPRLEAMKADPLMRYFVELRNEILKEGRPTGGGMSVHIEHLTGDDIRELTANPPPGATSFFIGDYRGGSGWFVQLPDGTTDTYYVRLPDDVRVTVSDHLPNPPTEHRGKAIKNTSIESLCRLYVRYLEELVDDAEREFGG